MQSTLQEGTRSIEEVPWDQVEPDPGMRATVEERMRLAVPADHDELQFAPAVIDDVPGNTITVYLQIEP